MRTFFGIAVACCFLVGCTTKEEGPLLTGRTLERPAELVAAGRTTDSAGLIDHYSHEKMVVPTSPASKEWSSRAAGTVVEYPQGSNDLGFGGGENSSQNTGPKVVHKNPNYRVVRVYFGTNRKLVSKGEAVQVSSSRANDVSLGECDVSIPASHKLGNIERPSIFRLEFSERVDRHVVLRGMSLKPLSEWQEAVRSELKGSGGKVVMFVHGYATGFDSAARRAAQLKYDLGFGGPTVFFSWPSKEREVSYVGDRTTVEASRTHLSSFLETVSAIPDVKEIILIAHSMGGKLAAEAMQAASAKGSGSLTKITELILAAPDIDRDVFVDQIAPVVTKGRRVTLYASRNDNAIRASEVLNEAPRVGSTRPNPLVVKGIDTIDASAVDTSLVGHGYYGDNRSVLSDMFYLVRERLPPSRRAHLRRVAATSGTYWEFAQ